MRKKSPDKIFLTLSLSWINSWTDHFLFVQKMSEILDWGFITRSPAPKRLADAQGNWISEDLNWTDESSQAIVDHNVNVQIRRRFLSGIWTVCPNSVTQSARETPMFLLLFSDPEFTLRIALCFFGGLWGTQNCPLMVSRLAFQLKSASEQGLREKFWGCFSLKQRFNYDKSWNFQGKETLVSSNCEKHN